MGSIICFPFLICGVVTHTSIDPPMSILWRIVPNLRRVDLKLREEAATVEQLFHQTARKNLILRGTRSRQRNLARITNFSKISESFDRKRTTFHT
mmetsp:Transcript_18660/g.37137  ORF Transcript_18660/g.37137 Transcript_18660/m.37137 type:complete len:95 (-) Transcript_18660:409-693(-)